MRPSIAMTALINHKGPGRDVHFIRPQIIDDLSAFNGGGKTPFGGASQIHRANACRCCVQDQQFAVSFFAKLHRGRQNRRAILALQSRLPQNHHRGLL